MKIYLAARYSRRGELRKYAESLEQMGHRVTSRWLNGSHDIDDQASDLERMRLACEDVLDVSSADLVVSFTDGPVQSGRGRGGRHVEFGIALAQHKQILIVGPRENVFHYLFGIPRVNDFDGLVAALGGCEVETITGLKRIVPSNIVPPSLLQ